MEIVNPIHHFSGSIERFVTQFSTAFHAIATPTDIEEIAIWFNYNYRPPSNLMHEYDKAKVRIWLTCVLVKAVDEISGAINRNESDRSNNLLSWLGEMKVALQNHTLPAIQTCGQEIIIDSQVAAIANETDGNPSIYRYHVMLKIIQYELQSCFPLLTQTPSYIDAGDIQSVLADHKLLTDLLGKLMKTAVSLHGEVNKCLIDWSQHDLLQQIKAWKKDARLYNSIPTFPTSLTDNLRIIRSRLTSLLHLQDDMLGLLEETYEMIVNYSRYDQTLQQLVNSCLEHRNQLNHGKNELILRSFFVMVQCYSAPKVDSTIECRLVFLADYCMRSMDDISIYFIGFTDQGHDCFSSGQRLQKQPNQNAGFDDFYIADIKLKLQKATRGVTNGSYVTDYRYYLGFRCDIETINDTLLKLECKTAPIAFRTGRAQNAKAKSTLAWDYHFIGDVDEINPGALLHRESISYSQLEKILEFEFERHLGRSLTPINLYFLKDLILGNGDAQNTDEEMITWDYFHNYPKLGSKKKPCSIGEWIFTCLDVLSRPENLLLKLWQEGGVVGFVGKNMVESILQDQKRMCLIRFSLQIPGAITIPYTDERGNLFWPQPMQCSGSQKSSITWIDLVLIDGRLSSTKLYLKDMEMSRLNEYKDRSDPEDLDGYNTSFPIL